jgi:uncharacterized protein
MMALAGAVFIASLLGSTHCAGMCGAFLAFAVAGGDAPSKAVLHAAYNGGRLVTYTVLGAIAGGVGAAVDLGASAAGLQQAAAMLAGAMMVGFGLVAILRMAGVKIGRAPIPGVLRDASLRAHRRVAGWGPVSRALAVGLLTTLLPCGWLYAFVITAAGTASPVMGAACMAIFWLGTLPMMVALGTGLQAVAGPLRDRLPLVTSLVLVAVGVSTLLGRSAIVLPAAHADLTGQSAVERVENLDASEAPCCHGD